MQGLGNRVLSSEVFWTGIALVLMLGAGTIIAGGLLTLSPVLVVGAVLALIGCGIILCNPYLGAVIFLALLYLRLEQFVPQIETLRLPLLLGSFTLFAWGLQVLRKQETFHWRGELGWVIAFAFVSLLSCWRLPGTSMFFTCLQDSVRFVLLFVLIQQLTTTEKRANVVLNVLLLVTVVLSLYAIHGWVTETMYLDEHGTKRARVEAGGFDDPNDLAAALVIPVPIALLLMLRRRSWTGKAWGTAALGVLLTGLYLTNSRGGVLALGVAFGVFLVYHLGWSRGCLLGAAGVLLLAAFGPDRFAPENLNNLEQDDSSMGRVVAWQAGLRMFERNPVLGMGYEQFEIRHVIPAHNSFVHALGEGGFLLALAWVGFNYWAVLTLVRLRRKAAEEGDSSGMPDYAAAVQAGLLASLTAGMFLSHTYRLVPLIPVALAAALGGSAGMSRPKGADWAHYLLAAAITLGGIALMYVVVVVLL